jgi:hypothetical protein
MNYNATLTSSDLLSIDRGDAVEFIDDLHRIGASMSNYREIAACRYTLRRRRCSPRGGHRVTISHA